VTQAEHELLQLLTTLRANLVGVGRALHAIPGANKAHDRALALCFEGANDLVEREVSRLVGAEVKV
jgi:hypothetical protein